MDEYYQAVGQLPAWLGGPLLRLKPETAVHIHELRLRVGAPPLFTVDGAPRPAAELLERAAERDALGTLRFSQKQLDEILFALCRGSLHTYEDELSDGYFTLPGGHRVGVGWCYVHPVGRPEAMVPQTVTSLNLRIARRREPTLSPAMKALLRTHFTGLLLVGEPDSGKTTLLRGIASFLARCGRVTAVIDEREELFPVQTDGGGGGCDVVSGVDKGRAVQMALRTLSPEVIVLDELGGMEEVTALEQGFFGGVDFVATLHAASLADASRRPQVQFLRRQGMLRYAGCLAGRRTPGRLCGPTVWE